MEASCSKSKNDAYNPLQLWWGVLSVPRSLMLMCPYAFSYCHLGWKLLRVHKESLTFWSRSCCSRQGWDMLAGKHALLMPVPHLWINTRRQFLPLLIWPFWWAWNLCVERTYSGFFFCMTDILLVKKTHKSIAYECFHCVSNFCILLATF